MFELSLKLLFKCSPFEENFGGDFISSKGSLRHLLPFLRSKCQFSIVSEGDNRIIWNVQSVLIFDYEPTVFIFCKKVLDQTVQAKVILTRQRIGPVLA